MSSSRTVIAINPDPDAQIFHVADIGVVADACQFLPKLIEALKARKRLKNKRERKKGYNYGEYAKRSVGSNRSTVNYTAI